MSDAATQLEIYVRDLLRAIASGDADRAARIAAKAGTFARYVMSEKKS